MLFINTRPVDRAASLTMALEQRAVEVYALPLLELLPRAWDHDLARLYQQLAHTQVIVVVSPSAVQFGMAHLLQSGLTVSDLQHIQWIAVGQKTAQALAEYGWTVWCLRWKPLKGCYNCLFCRTWPVMRVLHFGEEKVGVSL